MVTSFSSQKPKYFQFNILISNAGEILYWSFKLLQLLFDDQIYCSQLAD